MLLPRIIKSAAPALALALALALASPTPARALDINRFVTDEGLTVLHVRRDNVPMVVFSLHVKAGTVHEPARLGGLAHLAGALLMEGTGTRSSTRISEEIEFLGASLGVQTAMDYSRLTLQVLRKDMAKGLEVMADVLLRPAFSQEELARKQDLIKGSLLRMEEDPSHLARRAFMAEVFGEHPYGRVVVGTSSSVDGIGREDVVKFHGDYYVPNNSFLAVVGDITVEELRGNLQEFFGGWSRGPVPEVLIPEPPQPKSKVIRIEKDLTQSNILLGHLGIKRSDPDYYPIKMANFVLGGGGFSSRLMESVRDRMGLAYDVHSAMRTYERHGVFEAGVQTKNSTAEQAIEEILRQIRLMRDEGPGEEELADVKSFYIGYFQNNFSTMQNIANYLLLIERHGLGLGHAERRLEYIAAVTREGAMEAARRLLDPDNVVLVIVGPSAPPPAPRVQDVEGPAAH